METVKLLGNKRSGSLSLPLSISVAIHILGLCLIGSIAFEYKREDSPQPVKIRNVIIESKPVEMEKPPADSPPASARGQTDLSKSPFEPATLVRASLQSVPRTREPNSLAMPSSPPAERVSAITPVSISPGLRQASQTQVSRPSIAAVKTGTTSKAYAPSAVSTSKSSGMFARNISDGAMKTRVPSATVFAFNPAAIQPAGGGRRTEKTSGASPMPRQPGDGPGRTEGIDNMAAVAEASDYRMASAIPAEKIAAVKTTDFTVNPAAFSGNGPSDQELDKVRGGFLSSVWEKLARAKHYPKIARDRGYEGEPIVVFTIGKDGSLIELGLDKSSPFEILNEAALQTVRDASPYPSIPDPINERTIKLKLPISFVLERP